MKTRDKIMFALSAVILVVIVSATNGGKGKSADKTTPPDGAIVAPPGAVSRSDVPKGEWPLTVSGGVVRCDGSDGIGSVIFRANGTDYAVNGTALTVHPELPKIERIWKRPDRFGLRVSMSPIIDRGLALC